MRKIEIMGRINMRKIEITEIKLRKDIIIEIEMRKIKIMRKDNEKKKRQ